MRSQKGSISIYLVIVLIVFALGGYFYLNSSKALPGPLSKSDQDATQVQSVTSSPSAEAQIIVTSEGLSPKTITVAKNQQISFHNQDTKEHQLIISDDEVETLRPNDYLVYSIDQSGEVSYQDLTTKKEGVIIVN